MVDYHLEELNAENAEKWDHFNQNSPEGSFFHSLKWTRAIEKESSKKRHYLLYFQNDAVIGILPLVDRRIRLFHGLAPANDPQRLHSIIKEHNDPTCLSTLIMDLRKYAQGRKKLSFICLSTLHKETIDIMGDLKFPCGDDGDMVLDLSESPPEAIWNNFSAKSGQRKKIRRFGEHGFEISEVTSHKDLALFYKYYEENIQHIGGTLQTFSHLTELWNILSPEEIRITLLAKGSIIAGGLVMFPYWPNRTVYSSYVSLNRNLPTTYHPSYALFWELVNWARDNNFKKISFGAQHVDENNPRYRVKKDFGAKFEPIYSKMVTLNRLCAVDMKAISYLKQRQSNPPSNSHKD